MALRRARDAAAAGPYGRRNLSTPDPNSQTPLSDPSESRGVRGGSCHQIHLKGGFVPPRTPQIDNLATPPLARPPKIHKIIKMIQNIKKCFCSH